MAVVHRVIWPELLKTFPQFLFIQYTTKLKQTFVCLTFVLKLQTFFATALGVFDIRVKKKVYRQRIGEKNFCSTCIELRHSLLIRFNVTF